MERPELPVSTGISQNIAQPEFRVDDVGMVLQLADGKIQACNATAELILGFTLEQMQGSNSNDSLWQAIHEDGSPFPGEAHPATIALSTGRSILGVMMGLYQPNGELMWLQIDAEPLFQAGETTSWAAVSTFRDRTAQRSTAPVQPRLPVDLPTQRTVLIVDDCLEDRETFRRYLNQDHRYRYRLLEAETGAEALEIYQQVELDAVLLDYSLPDYEGLELLHLMQQQNPRHVPIVLVTGQGSESIAVRLLKAGAEDYLIKGSLTTADLQAAIRDAIDKTELRLRLRQSQERERLVAHIAQQIRQSLDLATILNTTVEEVRQLFDTDRVLIFRFHPDWSGTVIAESVGAEWSAVLSTTIIDPCLATTCVRQYQQGRVTTIANIHAAEIDPCYVEMLAEFQVQANLVVPILQSDRLWGLLIAHHCAAPRSWQTTEIALLKQLSTQVGTAIQQAELYQQAQSELAERQRIEAELRDSELFVRKILDSTSECVKVLNLDGQLLYMNPGGQVQLGICDFARFALCQWVEFWNGDDRQAAEQAIAIAKAGDSSQFEGYRSTVDGIPKWWEVQVSPILDAEGNVERLLSVSRDITHRKASETALKTSKDHAELLYDTVKELLVSTQPLTLIDRLFENLKGLLELDLYLNYVVEDSPANADCSQMRLAAYGGIEPAIAREIEYLSLGQAVCGTTAQEGQQTVLSDVQNSDNSKAALIRSLRVTAYSSQPLIAQGQLFGTLSFGSRRRSHFTTDETELLQALCDQIAIALERANLVNSLQQQAEQLRQADRLKDEFLAVLSHELRTPLNPILGWTRLLQTRDLDEDRTIIALATIERNAKLQAQLIDDLLDISRIMRGKLTLNATPVNLATVISAALETVRLAAEAKHIQFEITIDDQVQRVAGDLGRLQQAVWNLLSNAIKFTDEAGRIEIRLTQVDHHAQVQIIDSGKGINPAFVPYVFEYFRQEDGSTTRKFGGLGLGLAIARQIIELHGGTIWAESAGDGYGAIFTFQIPGLNAVSSTLSAAPVSPLPTLPLSGIRVLIVDDAADTRDFLSFLLEQSGAIVTTAATAAAALQALEQSRPNILLSDIGMPETNGYDLIRAIRASEQGQNLPAIAITAYAGELNQQSAIAAGFQRHIAKPINSDQLILVIRELVGLLT
ncbi:MAG: response regulator [Stenomitos frigidus ULC029]